MRLPVIVLAVVAFTSRAQQYQYHVKPDGKCLRPRMIDKKFCRSPPVVDVDIESYEGKWFQLFVNDGALETWPFSCTTAQFNAELSSSSALNAAFCELPPGFDEPQCKEGRLERKNGSKNSGRFVLEYGNTSIPYYIAATLGDAQYGYYAAGIFSCVVKGPLIFVSWYIMARSPHNSMRTLMELLDELKCAGYPVDDQSFYETDHGSKCTYFGRNGFNRSNPPSYTSGP